MKLTFEQIKNWRLMLARNPQIGVFAFVMPDEEIEKLADHFQTKLSDSEVNMYPVKVTK